MLARGLAATRRAPAAARAASRAAPARAYTRFGPGGKLIKPTPKTPGQRHLVKIDRSELWKGRPVKKLTRGLRKTGGRNNQGRITVWTIGGGHKRLYRFVDFHRSVHDTPGTVQRLEYDPNRSCHIALVSFPDHSVCYIIAPEGVEPGDTVEASRTRTLDVRVGNAMPLERLPVGTVVHNLELTPGQGGKLCRSAGTAGRLLEKYPDRGLALVRLQSKEQRLVRLDCMATIGTVSNPLHKLRKYGKAGRMRWLGRRPTVRGVAMNPVDHPHGGGEGKSHTGRPKVTPWGKPTRGQPTRNKKKASTKLIIIKRGGVRAKKR